MAPNFNSELHARPSIYFSGPALVEHVALMPDGIDGGLNFATHSISEDPSGSSVQIERHTEFLTITRVTPLTNGQLDQWPTSALDLQGIADLTGLDCARQVCRIALLVVGEAPNELGTALQKFGLTESAASSIGGGSAQICSDFIVRDNDASRLVLFNRDLNSYRLGRMVRRICEIETYRAMALLALPHARRLSPFLTRCDAQLIDLTNRNVTVPVSEHRKLLDEISGLTSQVISAAAESRNRFTAAVAYSRIVDERISELRETHVAGFQRFGIFIARRFKPAVRTCEATSLRLERLSHAANHLLELLQTRIQVEIEFQNAIQIEAMANRAAVQLKIQRAVEGFSVIAVSYYLLGLLKITVETIDHAGVHVTPIAMLISIPVVIGAVALAIMRVKNGLRGDS